MTSPSWIEGLPVAVTVTDAAGTIIAMNRVAREGFAADPEGKLIGSSVFDCHPEPSLTRIRELWRTHAPNHYSIARNGQKKIIHQIPHFSDGTFAGYVEISVPVPETLPHFERA